MQDNALSVSAVKYRDVSTPKEKKKVGPPPNELVLPVIALWAYFKLEADSSKLYCDN